MFWKKLKPNCVLNILNLSQMIREGAKSGLLRTIKFQEVNSVHVLAVKNLFNVRFLIIVVGCIDGTHIGLQKPTVNEHMYFNRKGFHSINAMLVSFLIKRWNVTLRLFLLDLRPHYENSRNKLPIWGCSPRLIHMEAFKRTNGYGTSFFAQ